MQLKSRVFIVTGASSGLGAAVTRMLAQEGATVLGLDLKPPAGKSLPPSSARRCASEMPT